MDQNHFQKLLYRGESETLDFKVDQYSFSGATDEDKGELLKDILAFANAWRDEDAFILVGVSLGKDGMANALGITKHLDDAAMHQFVNSKTQKPITFSYEVLRADGKEFGVIRIPVQERPFYLKADYGRLEAQVVYIRRGSSTGTAPPDEISEMGKKLVATASFEIRTAIKLFMPQAPEGEFWLSASLFNGGKATAYDTAVSFEHQPNPGSIRFEATVWSWQRGAPSATLLCDNPIHRGMEQPLAEWDLGTAVARIEDFINVPYGGRVDPQTVDFKYRGQPVSMVLRVFARDLVEFRALVTYSAEEIEAKTPKRFPCNAA